ncbi:molybdopterin biosynthesis protein, partial [bacterium]
MSRRVFRELASIEEAKARLAEHFRPKPGGVEVLPLAKALGRVLSRDIEAGMDVPPFDRASMDGYAVLAEDTFGAEENKPVELRVMGRVGAGERPEVDVEKGTAAEISTGAPIPKGANAVIMVEYTVSKNGVVKVYRPVVPGENVMSAGSDIMAGEVVLRKATALTSRETAVAAALGIAEVQVFRRPVVAVISTGNEIVAPGARLEYGKIYDINSQSICDSVRECGGQPVFLGVARDEEEDIKGKIRAGLTSADIVVISGGTSAGVGDLLYRIINDLGSPGMLVHGVAVRPGKPTIIAVVDGKPIFGLPGYPTSALMIFD